jgi:hypothetical protein
MQYVRQERDLCIHLGLFAALVAQRIARSGPLLAEEYKQARSADTVAGF